MNILVCSKESNGGDMALRLGLEGHKVKFHIHADEPMANLDGLIDKEPNWRSGVQWADFTVLDDTGMDDVTSFLVKTGKPAFGMGRKDATLGGKAIKGYESQSIFEKDRAFFHKIVKQFKVGQEIESLSFSNIAEAIKHLKEHRVAHVIKPETSGSGSEKTYVGELDNGEDAIGWLETLPDRPDAGKIKKIEVEERIKGVEVAASFWFNGKEPVGVPNINFEHKRIATGEIGFNTGEMGTAMFYDSRGLSANRFARETIAKMVEPLAAVDYRGKFDLNCIVNQNGIYVLEATPRLGYPISYIEDEAQISPWGEMLYAIAKGESYKPKFSGDWCIGVVLVGEGYPFWDEGHKRMDGQPVLGLSDQNIDHLHFYDIAYKKNRFITTGCYPLVATAKGKTIAETKEKVYNQVKQVYFPSMYYRTDIGNRVKEDLAKLKGWGYDCGRME